MGCNQGAMRFWQWGPAYSRPGALSIESIWLARSLAPPNTPHKPQTKMKADLEIDLDNLKVPWTVQQPTHCAGCAERLDDDEVPLLLFRDIEEKGRVVQVVGIAFHFTCAEKRITPGTEASGAE